MKLSIQNITVTRSILNSHKKIQKYYQYSPINAALEQINNKSAPPNHNPSVHKHRVRQPPLQLNGSL